MKKKSLIILIVVSIIILITGIILLNKNNIIKNKRIEIIDATFSCAQSPETFYEDDKYIYSFPCVKSSSIYVKFENGTKVLVVDALEEEKVTIDELLDAGLEVHKTKK